MNDTDAGGEAERFSQWLIGIEHTEPPLEWFMPDAPADGVRRYHATMIVAVGLTFPMHCDAHRDLILRACLLTRDLREGVQLDRSGVPTEKALEVERHVNQLEQNYMVISEQIEALIAAGNIFSPTQAAFLREKVLAVPMPV